MSRQTKEEIQREVDEIDDIIEKMFFPALFGFAFALLVLALLGAFTVGIGI